MNDKEALEFAARILEADEQTSYHPDVDHSEAIEVLRDAVAKEYRLARLKVAAGWIEAQ